MTLQRDKLYLGMANKLAKFSTCLDKQVGCLLVDKDHFIIATGYNGAPHKYPHCTDNSFCRKVAGEACLSAHAEQNALIQCNNFKRIYTCYTTLSPCITCIKMLMNTPCKRIIYLHEHRDPVPRELWEQTGGIWQCLSI